MAKRYARGKAEVVEAEDKNEEFTPDTQPVVVVPEEKFDLSSDDHRKRILELKDTIGNNSFELCKLLGIARQKERYKTWGYSTYKEYVHTELGISYSKAKYMADLWLRVGKPNPKLLEKVSSEGWDKAKQLVNVVNEENVDEWLSKAKHLNADDLKKEVKSYLMKLVPNDAKAALSKEEEVKGTPVENVTKTMGFNFAHDEYMTLCKALDHVQAANPEIQSKGAILALICADFLGSNSDGEVGVQYVVELVKKFERLLPIRFLAVNMDTKSVVYGDELIAQLTNGA